MKWTFLHRSWSDLTALISPPWSKLHQERRKAKEDERANYEEHQATAVLLSGIRAGKYLQGTLHVSPYNPFEARTRQLVIHHLCRARWQLKVEASILLRGCRAGCPLTELSMETWWR